MMGQRQTLRVLIVSQQSRFEHVLATNVRCWGYEVEVLPSLVALSEDVLTGDVVLYDLDEYSWISKIVAGKDLPLTPMSRMADFLRYTREQGPLAPFAIVLSSRSVSRQTLEQLGAIAFLHKPFGIGRLERYLRVLQQLLFAEIRAPFYQEEQRVRILVAEDNALMADAVRQYLLDESGYDVAVAHDGLDALEQYVTWHPQCIVTDLIMPLMNGYQVMRCVAASTLQAVPAFVVMSALTKLENPFYRAYLEGKVVVYVNKPFHIEHLLTAIEQALHSVRMTTRPLA